MKTEILPITATIITAVLILNNTNAQIEKNNSYDSGFRDLLYDEVVADSSFSHDKLPSNNINLQAVRDFIKRYSKATNARWYTTDDGGFVAIFNEDSIKNIVAYNKAGNWIHTIRRYYEKDMPKHIRAIVKRIYYDYSIRGIEEIADPKNNSNIFLVHIQDSATTKILKVYDDEVTVLHEYKRS